VCTGFDPSVNDMGQGFANPYKLKRLRSDCVIKPPREVVPLELCQNTRGMLALTLPGCYQLYTHAPCQHNELRSLHQRVLMSVPIPEYWAIQRVGKQMQKIADNLICLAAEPIGPFDLDQIVSKFPAQKRRAYTRALDELLVSPLSERDLRISAFIKAEKLLIYEKNGDPRMIQFRSLKFNLLLGRYTRSIEKLLYKLTDRNGDAVIMKGKNEFQRAGAMWKVWQRYDDPCAMAFDLSRWDAHCSIPLLEELHKFYLTIINTDEFSELLKCQLVNQGTTSGGWRYTCPGGVMSGDMTTALGNCIMLVSMVFGLIDLLGLESRLSLVDDGDDHCLIGNECDVRKYASVAEQWFKACGHSLKVEGFTKEFHQILFCQHKPVTCVENGRKVWRLMPNPRKVLATSLLIPGRICKDFVYVTSKFVGKKKYVKNIPYAYLAEVWLARAIMHQGMPILGPFFWRNFKKVAHHCPWIDLEKRQRKFKAVDLLGLSSMMHHGLDLRLGWDGRTKVENTYVSKEARLQVSEAWGISVEEQLWYEHLKVPLPNVGAWRFEERVTDSWGEMDLWIG